MGLKAFYENGRRYEAADKIRPKWDWKSSLLGVAESPKRKIKSDQNGIESVKKYQLDEDFPSG